MVEYAREGTHAKLQRFWGLLYVSAVYANRTGSTTISKNDDNN